MQKSSPFHLFIPEMQSVLESCGQTRYAHFWPCPPKNILINFYVNFCINMQKIRQFPWFVLEIWLIKKSCHLIGWEHYGPYLRNKNFPKYGTCAGTQQTIKIFIIKQIQWKFIIKFFNKFKKTQLSVHFPNFGDKKVFSGKWLPRPISYGFLALCQNLEKYNDIIPRKCMDRQKDEQKDGRMEGRSADLSGVQINS